MSDSSKFDLAVIGAGPAGAAAAITAARFGAQVALFEAGSFPRQKVCGEFVSAESLEVLHDFLREIPEAERRLKGAPVIGETRLWFRGRSICASVDPPGLSIPRYDLDLLLWTAAQPAGVCAFDNCEVQSVDGEGAFRISANGNTITAAAVIIASGRWSRFSPHMAVASGPKWLGIKAHFREKRPPLSTDLYFFEGGYCGIQPVGENLVNACAMVRSDVATVLAEVFDLDVRLAERTRSWQPVNKPVSTAPLIHRKPTPVNGNMLLVGDAAAFIDPFVGDGISIALRTGTLAARILEGYLQGSVSLTIAAEEYRAKYAKQFAASIHTASRIRSLLSWPRPLQIAVFELLRTPEILPYLIRKTRRANQQD